jgi:predicted nucleic acid-binding protein
MDGERPAAQLELELGAEEVGIQQLISASSIFAGLLREVAREYLGNEKAVRWVVTLDKGSVRIPVRGEPVSAVSPEVVEDLTQYIASGLMRMDEEATRPPYFTNKALEQAKALANLASDALPIIVRNGHAEAKLTKRVMTHVDEVLGPPRESFGTVEGRLEAINIHGPNQFVVFDNVSGTRAECYFGDRIPLEDVGTAIGHRVSVRGAMKTRADGSKHIDVTRSDASSPSPSYPARKTCAEFSASPGEALLGLGLLPRLAPRRSGQSLRFAPVVRSAEEGNLTIVTSALTIAEVLYLRHHDPIPADSAEAVRRFFEHEYILISELDRTLAENARELFWSHGTRPKDAIHVATALDANVEQLDTFDESLIAKSGTVGNPPLVIGRPNLPKTLFDE